METKRYFKNAENALKYVARKSPHLIEAPLLLAGSILMAPNHPLKGAIASGFSPELNNRTIITVTSRGQSPQIQADYTPLGIEIPTRTPTPTETPTPTSTPSPTATATETPTPEPTETPTPNPDEYYLGCRLTDNIKVGKATYYSHAGCVGCSPNQVMYNGEFFDENKLTIAYFESPINSMVKITNLETSLSTIAKVTDRGGFRQYGILADLSLGTMRRIGGGMEARVRIQELDCR